MRSEERLHEAFELVFEARDAAATVEHLAVAAGPGRVRFGIDVQNKAVAFAAIGGARLIFGSSVITTVTK